MASGEDASKLPDYIELNGGLSVLRRKNSPAGEGSVDDDNPINDGPAGKTPTPSSGHNQKVAAKRKGKVAKSMSAPPSRTGKMTGTLLVSLSLEGHEETVRSLLVGSRARLDVEVVHIDGEQAAMVLDRIREL